MGCQSPTSPGRGGAASGRARGRRTVAHVAHCTRGGTRPTSVAVPTRYYSYTRGNCTGMYTITMYQTIEYRAYFHGRH